MSRFDVTNDQHTKHNLNSSTFLPPATIGILGGGQLGRMMALEARAMGYNIVTLDPTQNSPCGQIAAQQIIAPFDDLEKAQQLAQLADVITYEFENISSQVAEILAQESVLPQGYKLLYTTQNRIREKKAIEAAGIKVVPYYPVANENELLQGLEAFDYQAVLKTSEGGYDGKGQVVIHSKEDIVTATNLLAQFQQQEVGFVLEQWTPFTKELSVIVARSVSGEVAVYPVVENEHRQNILHLTIAPAQVSEQIAQQAREIGLQLAEKLELVGTLAIEMFLLEDGTIFVNELAPRPHNSGHYTQEGCYTSQFEQHIRAICNLKLGSAELYQPTVMVNILGQHLEQIINKLPELPENCKLHLYGKAEAKHNRKMGHLNIRVDDVHEALWLIKELGIWHNA